MKSNGTEYREKRLKVWQARGIKISGWQEYEDMYWASDGKCEVCNTPLALEYDVNLETARLDHNHETGEPRAILCNIHNRFMWPLEQYGEDELIGIANFIVQKMIHTTPPESISGDLRGMKAHEGIIQPEGGKKR